MKTDKPTLNQQHKCFGRYMEPKQAWTDSGGGCSQECALRHECYRVTHQLSDDERSADHKKKPND